MTSLAIMKFVGETYHYFFFFYLNTLVRKLAKRCLNLDYSALFISFRIGWGHALWWGPVLWVGACGNHTSLWNWSLRPCRRSSDRRMSSVGEPLLPCMLVKVNMKRAGTLDWFLPANNSPCRQYTVSCVCPVHFLRGPSGIEWREVRNDVYICHTVYNRAMYNDIMARHNWNVTRYTDHAFLLL